MNKELVKKLKNIFEQSEVFSKHQIVDMEDSGYDMDSLLLDIKNKLPDYKYEEEGSVYDILWQIYDDIDSFEENERKKELNNIHFEI